MNVCVCVCVVRQQTNVHGDRWRTWGMLCEQVAEAVRALLLLLSMSAPGKGIAEHMKLCGEQPSEGIDRSNDLTAAPGRVLSGCDIIDGV